MVNRRVGFISLILEDLSVQRYTLSLYSHQLFLQKKSGSFGSVKQSDEPVQPLFPHGGRPFTLHGGAILDVGFVIHACKGLVDELLGLQEILVDAAGIVLFFLGCHNSWVYAGLLIFVLSVVDVVGFLPVLEWADAEVLLECLGEM